MKRYKTEIAPEDYLAHPGERWSLIKELRKSPLHYQHARSVASKQTKPMAIGSAVHTLAWEPQYYEERFAVYAPSKSKGEGARTNWEAFQVTAAAAGLVILTPEEDARARCMAEVLATYAPAGDILQPGVGRLELPLAWTDPRTGLERKARLDWLTDAGLLADLKSTRSGDARRFASQAWALGYFHQGVWYQDAVAAATGVKAEAVPFRLIAVESEAPYDVAVFEPCADTMHAARQEVEALIDLLLLCRHRNEWPGRFEQAQVLSAPAYVLDSDEDNWNANVTEATP